MNTGFPTSEASSEDITQGVARPPVSSEKESPSSSSSEDFYTKKIKEIGERIDKLQTHFIEVLGIFVALFTFVSVDIQFSRAKISFWSLVGFTLITLGGLVLFIALLHISLRSNSEKWKLNLSSLKIPLTLLFILCFLLLGAGVGLVWKDGNKILREDFFVQKQRETKKELLHITNDLASTSEAVGSVLKCRSGSNTYWDFKNCTLK